MTLAGELAGLLGPFLPAQRWFAGRGRPLRDVAVERAVPLGRDGGGLLHVVARAVYDDGGPAERYQVPLATARAGEPAGAGAVLGVVHVDGRAVQAREATGDAAAMLWLLGRMAAGADEAGLRFRHTGEPAALRARTVRPVGAEQSNTSVVLDDRLILKLFRRLHPGVNPELELILALAGQGFEAIATPLGWAEAADGTTLALVQRYHAGAVEGWALATGRAAAWRDGDPGGRFDDEAVELGTVTAALHRALAAGLGTRPADAATLAAERARRLAELDRAVAAAPALRAFRDRIAVHYDAAQVAGVPLQRVHGDYHLGQVLRTAGGRWIVLDFEGEPVRPVTERRQPASPLRDVAGMLRSLDYAAFFQPAAGLDGAPADRAVRWASHAREAFLAGYGDGREAGAALLGFELEKAVYEVSYEARYRPDWLPIPLGGIARLLDADHGMARPRDDRRMDRKGATA